jgi:hypothetical protein
VEALVPLVIAVSGLPALGIAIWSARAGDPFSRGTALRWALIALSILCGAAALYFAGGSRVASTMVVLAMVLAVNGLVLSLVLHLRRGARGR